MASAIPHSSRKQVEKRDAFHCVRCGIGTVMGQWHHRRSRSIRDQHQHCSCNGVYLCSEDHRWVHAHPLEARASGLIVSRHQMPHQVPFQRNDGLWVLPDCAGGQRFAHAADLGEALEALAF